MNEEKKYCAHRKLNENGVCPDCKDFIAFYEKYTRDAQAFRFNEDGELIEVFRGSEWCKEGWEIAGATEGLYDRKRRY